MIIILVSVIIILVITSIVQRTMLVVANRKRHALRRNIAKERESTADILTLSRDAVIIGTSDKEFLSRFTEYVVRTLKGEGGASLVCGDDGQFYGCSVAGIFPPLREVPPQVEQQLMAHTKKHTEFFQGLKMNFSDNDLDEMCGSKGYAFFKDSVPIWLPQKISREAPRLLIAPIKIGTTVKACIIVASKNEFDSHSLDEEDGLYLVRLAELASLSLEVIRVFRERQEYEERLQSAREEGMVQVSTGIIHNIGNAVTVAKLSVQELQEKLGVKQEETPEKFILDEIIPQLKANVESGSIGDFLKADPVGSQFLDIIKELIEHSVTRGIEAAKQLESLSHKLYHISEIIELQQRFVGELGTENLTQINRILDSSIKIFEETFNKRGVKISTAISDSVPEVLVDSSMMTQVFMNLIKNAVEAIDMEHIPGKEYTISVYHDKEVINGSEFSVVKIKDNGPGIRAEAKAKLFSFGFSTKGKGGGHGFGLHSCMSTVKKYGGMIEVISEEGKGAEFVVSIPVHKSEEKHRS